LRLEPRRDGVLRPLSVALIGLRLHVAVRKHAEEIDEAGGVIVAMLAFGWIAEQVIEHDVRKVDEARADAYPFPIVD